jgi:hypothetical protein
MMDIMTTMVISTLIILILAQEFIIKIIMVDTIVVARIIIVVHTVMVRIITPQGITRGIGPQIIPKEVMSIEMQTRGRTTTPRVVVEAEQPAPLTPRGTIQT